MKETSDNSVLFALQELQQLETARVANDTAVKKANSLAEAKAAEVILRQERLERDTRIELATLREQSKRSVSTQSDLTRLVAAGEQKQRALQQQLDTQTGAQSLRPSVPVKSGRLGHLLWSGALVGACAVVFLVSTTSESAHRPTVIAMVADCPEVHVYSPPEPLAEPENASDDADMGAATHNQPPRHKKKKKLKRDTSTSTDTESAELRKLVETCGTDPLCGL